MWSKVLPVNPVRSRSGKALALGFLLVLGTGCATTQTAAPAGQSAGANAGDQLVAPLSSYEEKANGVSAKLTFYPYSLGASLLFTAQGSGKDPVPLDLQAQLLDPLLGHLFRDHPSITKLQVHLGGNREALLPGLGETLASSKAWDSLRGRPLHGQLGAVLIETFNSSNAAGPLAQSFKAHGFSFNLRSVGRIDIEKDDHRNGARVPVHIDEMEFEAVKLQ